ncbi:flagellar export chaperone FliS [Cytobacillus sp. FJAT-54145]|uniref:Flagellar export chaperone FliS n=1 Tax=Cytobacillus spartinae TaxID=3299023 RepID=A0ABW6KBR4_9BACI
MIVSNFITEELIYQKNPQEITSILYEACLTNLEDSLEALKRKDYEHVNKKLQNVNDILHRLGAGINYEKGGIISDQLDAIYNYLADRLIQANFYKDEKVIHEVLNIITMIATAWNEAMSKNKDNTPIQVKKRHMAYEKSVLTELD